MYKAKDTETMTEPPPSQEAGGGTSQRQVFDARKVHQEHSKAGEDQAKARSAVPKRGIGDIPEDVAHAGQAAEVCILCQFAKMGNNTARGKPIHAENGGAHSAEQRWHCPILSLIGSSWNECVESAGYL